MAKVRFVSEKSKRLEKRMGSGLEKVSPNNGSIKANQTLQYKFHNSFNKGYGK